MASWLIFPLFVLFIFTRLFSYFRSSVPLGYDSGLYLHLFKNLSQITNTPLRNLFSHLGGEEGPLPDWLIEMYPPGIPVFGKILSYFVNPEKFLVPLIIFFSALLFLSVYILAKRLWDKRTALWTVFIFCCSAIQYRAYWYYYLKNIAALSFLLLTINYLLLTSYLAIPFAILVAYFHRPTFALLLVALMGGIIFEKKKRRFYGIVLGLTIAATLPYYLPTFGKTVLPLIKATSNSLIPQGLGGSMGKASGTFYNPLEALVLSMLYLPFALYGFKKEGFKKKNLLITAPLLASLFIVIFRLFFFRRFIVFADIFLIFFAGYGVAEFISLCAGHPTASSHRPRSPFGPPRRRDFAFWSLPEVKKLLMCLKNTFQVKITLSYVVALLVFIIFFIYKTGKPLIYEDELREIKMLSKTEKGAYVLVTDEAYMPWAYGWSERKVIAPGYGEYDIYWTTLEWHQFWESGDRDVEHKLLLKLPKPLYIYSGDFTPMYKFDFSGECFERINWRTFKFICKSD